MAEKETSNGYVDIATYAKKLHKDWKTDDMLRRSDIIPGYVRIPTQALASDYPLYGGEVLGRISQDSGMFHCGKTVSSGTQAAAIQRMFPGTPEEPDGLVLYIDAEHALDVDFYCLMNNIDPSRLFVFEPEIGMSGEQILEIAEDMLDKIKGLRYMILDSVASLVSEADMSGEFTKDNGMRATVAKALHKFCRQILPIIRKRQIAFKFINQSRVIGYMRGSGGSQIPIYGEYGGTAIGFFSSTSKRFGTRKFIDEEGNELSGTKGDGAAGFRIYFSVIKNKTAPTARGGGFITYYYETGIDYVGDAFDTAVTFGYIPKKTERTYMLSDPETGEIYVDENGKELTGYPKALKNYLKEHPEFCQAYISKINKLMSAKNTLGINLLSAEQLAEIEAEEKSIAGDKKAAKIELEGITENDSKLVSEE